MNSKQETGKIGEEIAKNYLERKGYKIIERNFRCRQGEIDIIAMYSGKLIFVEVKTRRSEKYGNPAEAVNGVKQKHMINAARYYLYKTGQENKFIRFDVVEVKLKDGYYIVNHIEQIK